MSSFLIFAGTTEGRELYEYCVQYGIPAHFYVATEYGEEMLQGEHPSVKIHQGRLDREKMGEEFRCQKPEGVIDATHPYANVVSANIKETCEELHIPYLRVQRSLGNLSGEVVSVKDMEEAMAYLQGTTGNILGVTGSKEAKAYTKIPAFQERVFLRILPSAKMLEQCLEEGFSPKNIICMQGPFSTEFNQALIRQTKAKYLVTKQSGEAGGFQEKLEAARREQIQAVVILPPKEEEGESLETVKKRMRTWNEQRLQS